MYDSPDSAWTGGCLSREVLHAYDLGKLPAAMLESIAEHVTTCPDCDAALREFHGSGDRLVWNLRRYVPAASSEALSVATPSHAIATVPLAPERPSRPAGELLPRRFGRYELLEEINRGGMGVVYKARQAGLNRVVALKMPFSTLPSGAEALERFRLEGQAIARLDHEHIVRVYDCDEQEGRPYFSMEYVDGGTLSERIAAGVLPGREAAELVAKLAQAVQYAHEQGVVHRDLKPGNVLLGTDGEVKLSDFGLAKLLEGEEGQTWTEGPFGTPCYMAPEQAGGEGGELGPAIDVYGLGAILYQALTGCPPFRGKNREATLAQVRARPPVPPSRLVPGLSRNLEAICLRCLAKSPKERYGSAGAFAEDLSRWLRGEATVARPLRWYERIVYGARRRPIAAGLAAVAVLASVGLPVLSVTTHSDRPVWQIEEQLARGKRVVLIRATGGPTWSRWRAQSDPNHPTPIQQAQCSIQSPGFGLLELVRDPQSDSYRFRAEVRHELTEGGGGGVGVGIYVAHSETPTPRGNVHQFIHLSFNDIREVVPPPFPPAKINLEFPTRSPVAFVPRFLVPEGTSAHWNAGLADKSRTICEPSGPGRTRWRTLMVEVTPEQVLGFWEGSERLGPLIFRAVNANGEDTLAGFRAQDPNHRYASLIRSSFSPRGGLGLYVFRGSAAFRSVTVEPL